MKMELKDNLKQLLLNFREIPRSFFEDWCSYTGDYMYYGANCGFVAILNKNPAKNRPKGRFLTYNRIEKRDGSKSEDKIVIAHFIGNEPFNYQELVSLNEKDEIELEDNIDELIKDCFGFTMTNFPKKLGKTLVYKLFYNKK